VLLGASKNQMRMASEVVFEPAAVPTTIIFAANAPPGSPLDRLSEKPATLDGVNLQIM